MKNLGLFFLLSLIYIGAAEECSCGVYVYIDGSLDWVININVTEVPSCADQSTCLNFCEQEFEQSTGGGDLDMTMDNGESLGENLCDALKDNYDVHNIEDAPVDVIANMCDNVYLVAGSADSNLCCHGGHYNPCITATSVVY